MPLPTRPVTMASVASEWGQQIHDYTFAPAGCSATGGEVAAPAAAAWVTLPIDTPSSDPGGYVDLVNNRLEIPTNGAGLYLIRLRCASDDGASGDFGQSRIRVNGSEVDRSPTFELEGSTAVSGYEITWLELDVGDLVDFQGRQLGSGARGDMSITRVMIVRIGFELGAPA